MGLFERICEKIKEHRKQHYFDRMDLLYTWEWWHCKVVTIFDGIEWIIIAIETAVEEVLDKIDEVIK